MPARRAALAAIRRATIVAAVVALAIAPSSAGVVGAADGEAIARARVLRYWTEARMRAAVPRDMTLPGRGPVRAETNGPEEVEVASGPWNGGGAIAARSGKVFFRLGGVDYVCSGGTIDDAGDPAYALVLTAAHCAYDEADDVFASNWIYVPDWDAAPTYDCTTVAYDCWAARALVVHSGWTTEESLTVAALQHDYAVAVVGPGATSGSQLDALGAYPVRIGPVPAGESADIFGYPAAPPFQGDTLTQCTGTVTVGAEVGGWRMTCDMTGGASGGPWLHGADDPADGSGSIGSVSSYRIKGDSGLYGPRLDAGTVAVIDAAKAATPDAAGIDGIKVSSGPPQTTILSGPASATSDTTATFTFSADEPATFRCSLDGAGFAACQSPKVYTGLAEGGHSLAVQATDNDGESDPTPASRSWTVDASPPVVSAPLARFIRGSRLGTTTVPVRLSWSATDGLTGIAGYELWQRTDGVGSWQEIPLPSPDTTRLDRSLQPGHAYVFEVRAADRAGNVGATMGATFDLRLSQEGAADTAGRWRKVSSSSASGGSYIRASASGAAFTYRFTGRALAWVAPTTPRSGKAKVYLDGVLVDRVNLYSTTTRSRVVVWTKSWSSVGTHRLRVVVVGTAGHPRVNLDALTRLD